ncbi:hypothetical protein [Nocardioides sp. KR10-350]|uniref:hypothetical protein n=1 Tax=Nocardioides cheoyonin TaxID=3156615 RepID=UPI0032B56759
MVSEARTDVDAGAAARILAEPTDRAHVDAWVRQLRSEGTDPRTRLLDLQERAEQPLTAVLLWLLGHGGPGPLRRRLRPYLRAFEQSDEVRMCRRMWRSYALLRGLDADRCRAVRALPRSVVQLAFRLRPPRIVPFDRADTEALDLSPDALRWYAEDFLRADPAGWPASGSPTAYVSDYQRERVARDEACQGFQNRLVTEGRLLVRDPHTGAECEPFDSVHMFGRTVYSFGERELTLLVAGGFGGGALYLALPRHNLLIDLGADQWEHMTTLRITNLHAELLRRVALRRVGYHRSRRAVLDQRVPSGDRRHVTVLGMMDESFAHHLWNFFPGLDRLVTAGLGDRVDELRLGGSEFFGPVVGLFPELEGVPVVTESARGVRDPHPFSADHLLVKPGGFFIRRALVERLADRMAALPPTPGAAQPPADPPFPVVWIGLRVDSRAWIDQEAEIPAVIDALHAEHPDALVVLDAFSTPVGYDEASDRWAGAIERLHGIVAGIRSRVGRPDRVVDLVGNSLRESVLWALVTDVHLAPNGTSQHKVGWFSDGPGISYGPPDLLDVPPEQRPGAYESEGRPIPETLVGHAAEQGELHHALDTRRWVDNVRLDRDEVVRRLLDLIAQRAGRRPAGGA